MAGIGQQGATASSSNLSDIVKSFYPDIFTSSYTVPPIHFNYVHSKEKTAPGTSQSVFVLSSHVGQSHPDSGQSYPNSGQNRPDSGQNRPDSGQSHPDSGQSHPDSGQNRPDSGQSHPDSGQSHPVSRQSHPNSGQSCPDSGQSHPERGQSHSERGQSRPDSGQSQPVRGQSRRSKKRTAPVTSQSVFVLSSPVGQIRPDSGQIRPDSGQSHPERGQSHPDSGQNHPDSGQSHPDSGQSHPKRGQSHPDSGQSHPKRGQSHPDSGQSHPKRGQSHPDSGQSHPKRGQSHPDSGQSHPKRGQSHHDSGQSHPKRGQSHPDSGQSHPKRGQSHPDSGQSHPERGQSHPDSGQSHPERGQSRPDSGQNRPDSGQNRPDSGQSHPDSGQSHPERGQSRSKRGQSHPERGQSHPERGQSRPDGQNRHGKLNKESKIQSDFAQQHVLTNLEKLAESRGEVMFIISELIFMNYLGLQKEPTEKSETSPTLNGDFDVFIIHRKHGILAGEIKSTGWKDPDVADSTVTRVIKTAIGQLEKSGKKAKQMAPGLTVRRTLILPYVSSDQLKRVLGGDYRLRQSLLARLNAKDTEEAVKLCLLSDQLSHPDTPWNVTPDVLSKLGAWWDVRMACTEDPLLTDQSYLDFVAKLVGPATTITVHSNSKPRIDIEVRTAGDAVAELARRLVTFVLTPEQVGLMNRNPSLICLTGPPGTGKTVVMELQGLRWLLQGRDVHLVSTALNTRAINIHIEHQLNMMKKVNISQTRTPGTVHRHEYDFYKYADYEKAGEELLDCVKDGTLHILMDEVNFTEGVNDGTRNRLLVTELTREIPDLHLWAARIGNRDVPPELKEENLRLPLRSAPSVLREIEQAFCVYKDITKYSNNGVPSPAGGLDVIRLSHHGDGHSGLWPDGCEQCGRIVAAKLHNLRVGVTGRMVDTCPAPLRYGDVFVLTRSLDLHDDVTDEKGKAIPASGFVCGLRAEGLPVCVLGRPDFKHNRARRDRDMADVAVGKMDKVTVAYSADVQGLERPVVVWLHGRRKGPDKAKSEDWIVAQDRLVAASRAMAQLIVVDVLDKPSVNTPEVTSTNINPTDVTATTPTTTVVTTEASPTDVTTSKAPITSDASSTDVSCCSGFSRLFFSRCCFTHYQVNNTS